MSRISSLIFSILAVTLFVGCTKDEEPMRTPQDIVGIWNLDEDLYLQFVEEYVVYPLRIEYRDGEKVGQWEKGPAYFYEPGYNLVIFVEGKYAEEGIQVNAEVYEIIELTESKLVWCPVDKFVAQGGSSAIAHTIGDVIKKAQEGYELHPELYQTLYKISQTDFNEFRYTLSAIYYPWGGKLRNPLDYPTPDQP